MVSRIRICHIADIHWVGGLRRHAEYKSVFEAFFEQLRSLQPDVVYIGGDIFHTKTQNISPEVIEHLGWWLREMASICRVVVTLGNHDGNLMNAGRQDAISPIVALLNHPNITLYKKSGVYPSHVPGINWCVFSCFDKPGWASMAPVVGEINIASFHGSVCGSKTETNHALDSEVSVEFFDGYDFALLGDIHKQQFLSYRDCVDGQRRPWIGYCGSTIQQNYGEDVEHGFLLWDITSHDDFDVKFIKLPNPGQFVTLDWTGDVDSLVATAREYEKGARFRIRSQQTMAQVDWRRVTHELKSKLGAREVVSKIDAVDDVTRGLVYEVASDLRNAATIKRLLREYYEDVDDAVDELVDRYVMSLTDADAIARNTRWSLESLEFSNTFAYGDDNVIDFGSLGGITGIFAPNAMGKSSIIGTMMYTLFNATDRGPMKNLHVINTRKEHCEGRAVLSIDGRRYEIVRSSKKMTTSAGLTHAVTALDFNTLDGQTLNGEQRTVTEKYVRQHIGTADDFMLTSLAVQGGLKAFVGEGAAQRKAILSRFLDLQLFEQIHDMAKRDSALLRTRVKDMPEREWAKLRKTIEDRLVEHTSVASHTERDLERMRAELAMTKLKLAGFDSSDVVTQADVEKKRAAVTKLNEKKASLEVAAVKSRATMDAASHCAEIVERVKSGFPLKTHLEEEQRRDVLSKWIERLEAKLKIDTADVERKNKSVIKLLEVPCGDEYPTCKYIRDSYEDKAALPQLKLALDAVRAEIGDKKRALESLGHAGARKLERYRRIVASEQRHRLRFSEASHKNTTHVHDLDAVTSQLEDARSELERMRTRVCGSDMSLELQRLHDDAADLEDAIKTAERALLDAAKGVGGCEEAARKLEQEHVEYLALSAEWRAYERLIDATAKSGIPSHILRKLTPAVNDEISRILSGIVGFTVELELPDDSNEMNVYIDYGDSRRIIELGSGMEKMIASIAIRVALINVSSLPKTDMFVIDEGFSELDEVNIDACAQLLRSLTRWFKNIVIITHIDSLKDVVDNVIDITRVGSDARVSHA